tara:strand:+ start:879 stop:1121 length:243 start_codon:yes stop_codon:yes gene_type:complete
MDNTTNLTGTQAINAAPLAQQPVAQPVYNKAIGSPMGVQRTPADPTGKIENTVATDLNFNANTREMGLMMYGGNKSRGIK